MNRHRSCTILFASLLLITISIRPSSSEPRQSRLTSRQILARMADVYANCSTYRDEGKVVSRFEEISFSTEFERPFRFRFEYTRSAPLRDRYVIWRTTSGDARSWWTIRRDLSDQPMNLAIATATGVSAASSHHIPRLLMPDEVDGFSLGLDDWVDVAVPDEETVNGRACYKLSGHYPASPTTALTLWIDKETFLIRKVFANEATVTYSPQLNTPIEQSTFQFQPPLIR
jgi:outer membrane lipoprotein-sorting protein